MVPVPIPSTARRLFVAFVVAVVAIVIWPATTHAAPPPPPTMSVKDVSVVEGDSGSRSAQFVVGLSAASTATVTASWATQNGTATAGSDYTTSGGTVTFAPGETGQILTVPVTGDTTQEPNGGNPETFHVKLTGPAGATFADDTADGFIEDDDDPAVVSFNVGDIAVFEGDTGTTNARYTIDLSQPQSAQVSVHAQANTGSAVFGVDFQAFSGNVVFNPGVTSKTVDVPVIGDTLGEPHETMSLLLSSPSGATLGDAIGVATIVDDNDVVSKLSVDDVEVREPASGTSGAQFTVRLDPPTATAVSVRFVTSLGTATGADFTARTGTLTFPPNTTQQTFSISVLADSTVETPETFGVSLFETQAVIGDGSGTGTILDASTPIANAGTDKTVAVGAPFTLDGSASSVPSGPLTYAWSQLSGPPVTITDADKAVAHVQAVSSPAGMTFQLKVTGDNGLSDVDDVAVKATAPK